MKGSQKQRERFVHGLLDLWMGDKTSVEASRHRGLPFALLAGAAALIVLVLARYAIDILLIAMAIVAAALFFHVVASLFVRSELISPSWLLIIVLSIALGAWLFLPSASIHRTGGGQRYMPKSVEKVLAWSEKHGLRLAIFDTEQNPADAPPPQQPPREIERGTPEQTATVSPGVVHLVATQGSSRAGQAVTFTAILTFAGKPWTAARGQVTFEDNGSPLGTVRVVHQDLAVVAVLTTRALQPGKHTLVAKFYDEEGGVPRRSRPLVHEVLP